MTKKPPVDTPRFWWFAPPEVDALRERLTAAGGGTRLEVRVNDKDEMLLRIVPAGAVVAAADDLNKSHVCPPFCP